MILTSEYTKVPGEIFRVSTILSEVLKQEDIAHLIINFRNGDAEIFFNNIKLNLYLNCLAHDTLSYPCREVAIILGDLGDMFQKNLNIQFTDLSVKDKVLYALLGILTEEKNKIRSRQEILQNLEKLKSHFEKMGNNIFTYQDLKLFLFQSSEDFSDLVDYLQSPKGEVRKRIDNVIFVKF